MRRGNENDHVRIFRYVTKGTFDAYTWGLVESKQKFIGQVMTSKSPARSIEDVDAAALSCAEVKMLATGDTRIKEKMDLDIQVTKLKMLKSNHLAQQYEMQDNEKYMGDALLQKTYTVDFITKKKIVNNGIVPQYYVEDNHEAIISKELFFRVQEEIMRRSAMCKSAVTRKKKRMASIL